MNSLGNGVMVSGYGVIAHERVVRCLGEPARASAFRLQTQEAHDEYLLDDQKLAAIELTNKKSIRWVDRTTKMVVGAARVAFQAAGLTGSKTDSQAGMMVGTGLGCLSTNEEFMLGYKTGGPLSVSPLLFAYTVPNAVVGAVATELKLLGPTMTYAGGASAVFAAGWSATLEVLRYQAKQMILAGYESQAKLATRFQNCWDTQFRFTSSRAEGAGVLIMESEEVLASRQGKGLARILGWGMSFGGERGLNFEGGLLRAVTQALTINNLNPHQISMVIPAAPATSEIGVQERAVLRTLECGHAEILPPLGAITGFGSAATGIWSIIQGIEAVQAAGKRIPAPVALVNVFGFDGAIGSLLLGAV